MSSTLKPGKQKEDHHREKPTQSSERKKVMKVSSVKGGENSLPRGVIHTGTGSATERSQFVDAEKRGRDRPQAKRPWECHSTWVGTPRRRCESTKKG